MYIGILWHLLTSFPSSTFNSIMSKRVIFIKHESDHMSICILYGYSHSCSALSLNPRERDQVKKKKQSPFVGSELFVAVKWMLTTFNTKKSCIFTVQNKHKGSGCRFALVKELFRELKKQTQKLSKMTHKITLQN